MFRSLSTIQGLKKPTDAELDKTGGMSEALSPTLMLSVAMGMLNSLLGEMEGWVGPSATAFQRDVQKLVADLEAADKAITASVVMETIADLVLEAA